MPRRDRYARRNEFNLNPFLDEKGIRVPEDTADASTQDRGMDHITRWKRAPFPLLICMNFGHPPIVPYVWEHTLRPALEAIGKPLCRIDWSTDDWVRDLRQVANEAAFVLMDLTEASQHTVRELRFMLQEKIPLICYSHHPDAEGKRISTVGTMYPDMARSAHGSNLDPEILSFAVTRANYEDQEDLARLCDDLCGHLMPFRDTENPAAPYYDTDTSYLTREERDGLDLARIPRSRIIGTEHYWERAQRLFGTSAIYRARVLSWLKSESIQRDSADNLWIREHLLWVVRQDVQTGHQLSREELDVIARIETSDAVEDVRLDAMDVRWLNQSAAEQALASKRGLPRVPGRCVPPFSRSTDPVAIQLAVTEGGRVVGVRASNWAESYPDSDETTVDRLCHHATERSMPRCFRLRCTGVLPDYLDGRIGQIEDQLDDCSQTISDLATQMREEAFSSSEIAVFIRAVASIRILQEIERADPGTQWGRQFHNDLMRQLSYVWGRDVEEMRLFEFSSSSMRSHFRGLLPWSDIKEHVIKRYAEKASHYLPDVPESSLREQAMHWDFPPSQAWDALLVTEMTTAVPGRLLRGIWTEYILPSALFYWRTESILVNPDCVDRWAYVVTE